MFNLGEDKYLKRIAPLVSCLITVFLLLSQQSWGESNPSSFRSQDYPSSQGNGIPLPVAVSSVSELQDALKQLVPGAVITIAPGTYSHGFFLKNVFGTREAPIIIAGADPDNPPVFTGRGEGAKLSSCSYVKLKNLVCRGFSSNGINIDDGGSQIASRHIVIENIAVLDTGPRGNHDALKLSGVDHFVVRNCRFEGWGGSAVDMVGCQHGLIEYCRFVGGDGFRTANSIQIKGGSHSILVQKSDFLHAGTRTISIGGSTGLQYFRPAPMGYEAKNVVVAGNTFVGSEAQVAWVTAQDSQVHHNLFYLPEKWVGRILQETKDQQFTPCQKGVFENNLVVTDERVRVFFNVGAGTQPSSFSFYGNAWYRLGGAVTLQLPVREDDGIYDVDPGIKILETGQPVMTSTDRRLQNIGPGAYVPWKLNDEFGSVLPPPVARVQPGDDIGLLMLLGGSGLAGLMIIGLVVYAVVRRRR